MYDRIFRTDIWIHAWYIWASGSWCNKMLQWDYSIIWFWHRGNEKCRIFKSYRFCTGRLRCNRGELAYWCCEVHYVLLGRIIRQWADNRYISDTDTQLTRRGTKLSLCTSGRLHTAQKCENSQSDIWWIKTSKCFGKSLDNGCNISGNKSQIWCEKKRGLHCCGDGTCRSSGSLWLLWMGVI